MKFRSKPITIEAEQFWPDQPLPFRERGPFVAFTRGQFYVTTAHGQTVELAPGDWVIPEPRGLHVIAYAAYPCKPEIFAARYEPVAEAAAVAPVPPPDARCLDCGRDYSAFGLDVLLPLWQWLTLHPSDGGLLCANCIAARASKIEGAVAIHAVIGIAPKAAETALVAPVEFTADIKQ